MGDISRALGLIETKRRSFEPPVIGVSAMNETGIDELAKALQRHSERETARARS